MARLPLKRQYVDERSRSDAEPPIKKTKTRSETELEAWASWKYPPEFWDRLSDISLTRKALEEHNRRVRLQQHPSPPLPCLKGRAEQLVHTLPNRSLARFARLGGPDLTDLRGHPRPTTIPQPFIIMSASQSSRSRTTNSIDSTSTLPSSATTKTTKTKKSTPYNRDFDLHLTDHGVHPVYSSQKPDLTKVRSALRVPRLSLSSSKFSESAFEVFQTSNARAKDENDVLANVIPTILGPHRPTHASARNTVFRNLEPLTDGTIAPAVPGIYYGAHPEDLCRSVRDELSHHIMPSTMQDKPLAPNFFIEVKGPDGSAAVATRQARYDGATGSRAMHSLQNYREEKLQYDGQAYTFSSTYHGGTGTLQLYAHHPTAPTSEGGRPEYHMTQVDTWAMTGNVDSFRRGATAFRNARDLAKQHRDGFIQAANAGESQSGTFVSQNIETHKDGSLSTDYPEWQNGDKLQPIANDSGHNFEDHTEATTSPQPLYIKGDSNKPSQDSVALMDDPSMSFASSLTPSFSTTKRPRQTVDPPSSSKNQKRPRKRRTAESTTAAAAQSEAIESQEDTK